jgi:hypothetical protein
MNANASARPIQQQSANSLIPLLAAILVALALVIGVAGVAVLTARSTSSTSPMFVPRTIVDHAGKDLIAPAVPVEISFPYVAGYEWVNGELHPLSAPVFVPQSNNIHEQLRTQSLGVPYPGGVAGPSQLDRFVAPGMGGH